MGCLISQLAAKFAFFPPAPPTYQVKKRDDGKLVATLTMSSSLPISIDDSFMDVLSIQTKRGNNIIAFYLRNPYARLTLLYSHGNAADLGQLYDLFLQLKANLRVNIIGSALLSLSPPLIESTFNPVKVQLVPYSSIIGLDLKSLFIIWQNSDSSCSILSM